LEIAVADWKMKLFSSFSLRRLSALPDALNASCQSKNAAQ
jgi:hypothetical protein